MGDKINVGYAVLGTFLGALLLAPVGLLPYGAGVGLLLGLHVAIGERDARRSSDWSDAHARTWAYKVGAFASGGCVIVLGLLLLLIGAGLFATR